jgi:hypothetical protein
MIQIRIVLHQLDQTAVVRLSSTENEWSVEKNRHIISSSDEALDPSSFSLLSPLLISSSTPEICLLNVNFGFFIGTGFRQFSFCHRSAAIDHL